ncbi:MAG TPA: sensor domain-containing diguanylate cyclase [Acidimicrobiales bacterium]|nr:sensor domain-containing diguanylate cyclase [Acidimicrobiales bacterium]
MEDPRARLRDFRRALVGLGDVLASTKDRQVMVSALLQTTTTYLGAATGVFYVVVAGSERLRPMETVGEAADVGGAAGELPGGVGLAGAASHLGAAVLWPRDGEGVRPSPQEPPAGAGALAIPLRSGGHPFGVLGYYGPESPFEDEDVDSIEILVRQAETAIENSFLYEEAVRLSLTDGMTGLWNRRNFDLRLESELSRAVRFSEPFAVVFVELDQMKAVNDKHGHQAGDTVLIELARRLTEAVREVDVVARWGGDEFTLLLPKTGLAGALLLAEKIRAAAGTAPFRIDTGSIDITISIGVAAYPEHGSSGKELVAAADEAMYRAKAKGRNRVEHAQAGEAATEPIEGGAR